MMKFTYIDVTICRIIGTKYTIDILMIICTYYHADVEILRGHSISNRNKMLDLLYAAEPEPIPHRCIFNGYFVYNFTTILKFTASATCE